MKTQHILLTFAAISCLLIKEGIAVPHECCEVGFRILYRANACQNGKEVDVFCNGDLSRLSKEWMYPNQYTLRSNSTGKYLDAFQQGFIVQEPNFCEGYWFNESSHRVERIAVICDTAKIMIPKEEPNVDIAELLFNMWLAIFNYAFLIFNTISFILLFITAFLYCDVREMQDSEGICTFHLSLNLAVMHLAYASSSFISYNGGFFCTIELSVEKCTELAVYTWAIVLLICMRNTCRESQVPSRLNVLCRCFAYALPILIFGLAFASFWFFGRHFYYYCFQARPVVEFFVAMSMVVTFITIGISLINLRKQIQYRQSGSLPNGNSFLKKATYRLLLYKKLFIILGATRIIILIFWYTFQFMMDIFYTESVYRLFLFVHQIFSLVFHVEGVFVFLLLVICRPRMRRAIARGCCANIVPRRWRTEEDPEDTPENVDSGGFNRQTPVDYPRNEYSSVPLHDCN